MHKNDIDGLSDDDKSHSIMLGVDVQNINKDDIIAVEDKTTFDIGDMKFEVIHTPGHTNGCICIYEQTSNVLFTGDTIFSDCYGRTDLKSGSFEEMKKTVDKLFKRFNNIEIYSGHGESVNIESAKKRIKILIAIKSRKN
ncbi:putative metallo-hydrolase [compost metagenome]